MKILREIYNVLLQLFDIAFELKHELERLNHNLESAGDETESERAERLYMEGISNVLNYRGQINERE